MLWTVAPQKVTAGDNINCDVIDGFFNDVLSKVIEGKEFDMNSVCCTGHRPTSLTFEYLPGGKCGKPMLVL